ncbi:hypothetical protein [Frondihabitans australicus]|uniref:hypothetical protein n=1 Tax=Frondihabitans australicus TaxID=386892 RepID=UPI0011C43792|nr:hypothetical protein [Frondihabitans australicus]
MTSGVINVDDHLFYLSSRAMYDFGAARQSRIDGLVSDFDGTLAVMAGIAAGPVRIHASLVDEAPQDLDTTPDTGSGRLITAGPLYFYGPDGDTFSPPEFAAVERSAYGVQIQAEGRDVAWDLVVTEPVEDYNVIVWPLRPSERFALLKQAHKQALARTTPGVFVGEEARRRQREARARQEQKRNGGDVGPGEAAHR